MNWRSHPAQYPIGGSTKGEYAEREKDESRTINLGTSAVSLATEYPCAQKRDMHKYGPI